MVHLVDLSSLDWTPKLQAVTPKRRSDRILARTLSAIGEAERLAIGTSEDTGVSVYRRARAEKHLRYEAVTPVLMTHQLLKTARRPRSLALDRVLPDRFSYIPKRPGSWAEVGFDPLLENFEEYVWCEAPFAFHLRPTLKGADRDSVDLDRLTTRLST